MSHLTPTPVVDKNGKQTTVHKKSGVAANTDRLAAVSGAPKSSVEKRSVLKRPKRFVPPEIHENDVVEVGSTLDDFGNAELYLNGESIGRIAAVEEHGSSKIAGSRLVREGAMRKTWRASGMMPAHEFATPQHISRHEDTKSGAAYSLAGAYVHALRAKEKHEAYVSNGGVSFFWKPRAESWSVNGTEIHAPEGLTLAIDIPHGDGMRTRAILFNGGKMRAEIEMNEQFGEGVNVFLPDGSMNSYSFERDLSLWGNSGNTYSDDGVTEFTKKVEDFMKSIAALRRNDYR